MINGQIKQILTQKENNWGRYKLDCAGKDMLVVGIIPEAAVGMNVSLDVTEENNKFGHQFKITSVLKTEADPMAGVRRFLTDGYLKGIGPTKARAMIAAFGEKCLDLLETPEGRKELTKVKGLSTASVEKIYKSYEENKQYKDIVLFLNGTGTKLQVEQIYDKYGEDSGKILKENPYRLQLDLDGFGFLKTDAIAIAGGIKKDSIYRVMAAIKYSIETAQSQGGHCYLMIEEIRKNVTKLLVPMPKFEDISEKVAENAAADWNNNREKLIQKYDPLAETLLAIQETVDTRALIQNGFFDAITKAIDEGTLYNDDGHIYTAAMYQTEMETAIMVARMLKMNPVRFIKKESIEQAITEVEERKTKSMNENGISGNFITTNEQRNAVFLGSMNRLSIVSGGPGRGKTSIIEIIAHAFLLNGRYYDKSDIIMLAPTGRAAQRITESTGYMAMTAHRAIIAAKKYGTPQKKLIICDECSMADVFLMHNILKYAQDCNLILVGDVNQIASVGPGKVLKDFIDSKEIPCIILEKGHRNSGSIAHNAQLINSGIKIENYCYDNQFVYVPCTKDNIINCIVSDYVKKVSQYGIKNVMLCAAMVERGCASVTKLNQNLQEIFTKGKDEARFGAKLFRVGDRVMQTKNDYNFTLLRNGVEDEGIFNGERGTVAKIIYSEEDESYRVIVVFDDGSIAGYTKNTIMNLVLAYATTLHKCQGSEAACMMMAYTFGDYLLLNRSLFYTGETRAKKEFRFYGEEKYQYGKMLSAFDIAVDRTDDSKRNTMLSERIKEAVACY